MDYNRDSVNRLISRNTKTLIGFFVVALIAAGLQAVGYATPGWVVFSGTNNRNETFTAGMNFWYQRLCTDSCRTGYIDSVNIWTEEENNEFETFKLIATVSAVLSIFVPAVIPVYIGRVRNQRDITTSAGTAVFTSLGAGVLAFVVVGKIASDVHTAYDHWLKTEDSDFELGFLYSEFLMGLGGALDFLVFIGLCVQIFYRKKDFCKDGKEEESVGMTWDSNR